MTDTNRPLAGIRVLEFTSVVLGPYACQMLADLGAEVIKIEPPKGDTNRYLGPYKKTHTMSALFLSCNRNKRSIVLDLKHEKAKSVVIDLVKSADVLIHNFRPQAMDKLGLSYQSLQQYQENLIYCGSYGYSKNGPYGSKGALDDSIQAASGIAMAMSIHSSDDSPAYLPTIISDKTTALMVTQSVLAALYCREKTGKGQEIEVPMLESTVAFLMTEHMWGMSFDPPLDSAGYPRLLSKFRKPYPTKDGFLAVLPYWDNHWETFCALADRNDLITNSRFNSMKARTDNIDKTCVEIANIIVTATTQEWLDRFAPTNIPHMIVNTFDQVFSDPHLEQTNYWKKMEHPTEGTLRFPRHPATFSKSNTDIYRLPPHLGEHSEEVLKELGYDDERIQELIKKGVTRSKS